MSELPFTPPPLTYEQRRADFIRAIQLLGDSQANVARLLDIHERTVRDLVSGRRHIHDGFMADITAALVEHASQCRELAKRTDPLFTANRVPPPARGYPSQQRAQNLQQEREQADG
jgi:DNA-binding transcriptional regulator YdaS (Cro superfamily)